MNIQKCSVKAVLLNQVINTFIESNKLLASAAEFEKISKGENKVNCSKLKVHNDVMKESKQEKYLGDMIHKTGNIKQTIEDKKKRACAIVGDILEILEDIPSLKWRKN